MKRSVRSGIAIAGMAGGFWLLGQAVADAAPGDPPPTDTSAAVGTQNADSNGGGSGGGEAESTNSQQVDASTTTTNKASSAPILARGGTSVAIVPAGNENGLLAGSGGHGNVDATQNVNTTVTAHSSAGGAKVIGSGNSSAGNGGSNSSTATGKQNAEATGGEGQNGKEDWHKHHHHNKGGDADSSNHQDVGSTTDTENNAHSGPILAGGGTSVVVVEAGNGNTLYCTSRSGNVTCSQNITTIINIISQAGGATVSCSGNASAGSPGSAVCPVTNKNSTTPAKAAPAAHKAAAPAAHKAAAPVAKKAPASAKAQPSGTLAFTGAETSLPLTLGLLALGVGGALTLAGRRRETATV
jgi:hypothetical protein